MEAEFLASLLSVKRGRGLAVNLWRGVSIARDVARPVAAEFLNACGKRFAEAAPALAASEYGAFAVTLFKEEALALLKRAGRRWVPITDEIDSKSFALLAHGGNVMPKLETSGVYPKHVILTEAGFRDLIAVAPGAGPGILPEPAIVARLRESLDAHKRLDARLGDGLEHVVFVTPADQAWEDHANDCEDEAYADALFDLLGLPRETAGLAILLTFDTAGLHDPAKRTLSAPTIFEGYRHEFFRQVEDRASHGGHGLTLHLGDLRAGKTSVGGAKEAVLATLEPWCEELDPKVVWLLPMNASLRPTGDDCADHLWGKLDEATLLAELRALAAEAPR